MLKFLQKIMGKEKVSKPKKSKKAELQDKELQILVNKEEREKKRIVAPTMKIKIIKDGLSGLPKGTEKTLDKRTANRLVALGHAEIVE